MDPPFRFANGEAHVASMRLCRIGAAFSIFQEVVRAGTIGFTVHIQEGGDFMTMEKFEKAYEQFMLGQLAASQGERTRRLKTGHGFGEKLFLEKVWWPAFGDFSHLNAEYEVTDFKDGFRYIDFAYIRSGMYLAIEIDGFGTHGRNATRWYFSDDRRRQNDLIIDDWRILRFSYDDVSDNPRYCQQTVQQFMGKWFWEDKRLADLTWIEKEIIRFSMRLGRSVTPGDLCGHLDADSKTARKKLHELVEKGWFIPDGGKERIRSYRLDPEGKKLTL